VVLLGQMIRLVPHLADRPVPVRLAVAAVFLVLALGLAGLSQRWVERPAQALARRILGAGGRPIATQRAATRTARGENVRGSV
jgi:peptidoglycan/LPS O-acetylase OafA/YrhL